jgi:hypothetical protein
MASSGGLLRELAHATIFAKHTGDGVMNGPYPVRWPSDNDIAVVKEWLS